MTENDRSVQKALLRFKIISAYLAENPPRGQRRVMLEHLSNKTCNFGVKSSLVI